MPDNDGPKPNEPLSIKTEQDGAEVEINIHGPVFVMDDAQGEFADLIRKALPSVPIKPIASPVAESITASEDPQLMSLWQWPTMNTMRSVMPSTWQT